MAMAGALRVRGIMRLVVYLGIIAVAISRFMDWLQRSVSALAGWSQGWRVIANEYCFGVQFYSGCHGRTAPAWLLEVKGGT